MYQCCKLPDQEHKRKDQVHVLDELAASRVPHKTSLLYENEGQNLYPGPCETELVQINF